MEDEDENLEEEFILHNATSGRIRVTKESSEDVYLRQLYVGESDIVQSEARLHHGIVQSSYLCPEYLRAMVAGMISKNPFPQRILVLGLGGGSLPTFLHHVILPRPSLTAVDLDPDIITVARGWFGLPEAVQCVAGDAFEYVSRYSDSKPAFDCIVVDIDGENSNWLSPRLSSPPPEFLSKEFLEAARDLLEQGGLFIVNFIREEQADAHTDEACRALDQASHAIRQVMGGRIFHRVGYHGDIHCEPEFEENACFVALNGEDGNYSLQRGQAIVTAHAEDEQPSKSEEEQECWAKMKKHLDGFSEQTASEIIASYRAGTS